MAAKINKPKKATPKKTVPLANVLGVAGILSLLIFVGGHGFIKSYLFNMDAPSADYPEPQDETEAQFQDLDYLELYVRGYDRSYNFRARGKGLQMIREAKKKAGEMSLAEFELLVSKVVALGENGHSNVWSGSRLRRHPALPIQGFWFDDGFFVVATDPENAHFLGAEITQISTATIAELYDLFRPYYGGEDTGYKGYNLSLLLRNAGFFYALGLIEDPSQVEIFFILKSGEKTTAVIETGSIDPDQNLYWSKSWLFADGALEKVQGWRPVFESEEGLPLYLQNGEQPFQLRPLPEIDGLYVQFRQNQDADDYPVEAFVDEIRAAINELEPQVLILDERFNGGGDYTETVQLMFDLPGLLPEGARIYAITGHETFSAAISSLGFLKEAAGGQMTIVGRQIGDSPLSWGETNEFILPNSGIGITAARGLHDQING
ncbi:MAG: hypothetical protein ACTSU8_02845, partial [Alphaproteobacteria bacterium]